MTEEEKKICDKYSARDAAGKVHCNECPLAIEVGVCKATEEMKKEMPDDVYKLLYGEEERHA